MLTKSGEFRFIHSEPYWRYWRSPDRPPGNPVVQLDEERRLEYVVLDETKVFIVVHDGEPRERRELGQEPSADTLRIERRRVAAGEPSIWLH